MAAETISCKDDDYTWDFPAVVKTPRSQRRGPGVPSLARELDPTCMPQLSSHATTKEPACCNWRSPHAATKEPACRNEEPAQPNK